MQQGSLFALLFRDSCRLACFCVVEMAISNRHKFLGGNRLRKPCHLRIGFCLLFAVAPLLFAITLKGYGDPPSGANPVTSDIKLLLGQPISSWTAAYGSPKSENGKSAVFQMHEGTAYVVVGNSGLTECASFVANIADLDHLLDLVTEICQSLGVNYKDDADGPKGKFHRYESKDGTMRAAITANPPQLVIVVQTRSFGVNDKSPITAGLLK
jgi:hypothetical protein